MLPRASGRRAAAVALSTLAALPALTALAALAACSSTSAEDAAAPTAASPSLSAGPSPRVVGANGGPVEASPGTGSLGPGFVTPTAPPPPGGTMTPTPGSWDSVSVPSGYTAALLSTDDTPAARHLTAAVRAWADAHRVTLRLVPAHDPADYVGAIQRAIDLRTDLVISAGDPLADPLAVVTASWPDQRFLLLGAELAEPTFNVTAAVWKGTTARGGATAGGNAWRYDPASFTVARAGRALEAGVAAVLRGYSGYVVRVD